MGSANETSVSLPALLLVVIAIVCSEGLPLRVELIAPPVALGQSAVLNCSCVQESEALEHTGTHHPELVTTVRWFRNGQEFFRYDRHSNEKLLFELRGLVVDVHSSHDQVLRLKRTSPESEALFACELTTSRFRVARAEARLQLYVLPKDEPQLLGAKARYHWGETFNATCGLTAKPIPELTWTVNDQSPPASAVVTEHAEEHNGLSTVFSRLEFNTSTLSWTRPLLEFTVACRAKVLDVYQRSAERRATLLRRRTQQQQHQAAGTGHTGRRGGSGGDSDGVVGPSESSAETETGPIIYGSRSHYHVGDTLNATCVFSGPDGVALRWLINEHPVPPQALLHFLEEQTSAGIVRTALGIRFRVKSSHFAKGRLTIRCEAIVKTPLANSASDVGPVTSAAIVHEASSAAGRGSISKVKSTKTSSSTTTTTTTPPSWPSPMPPFLNSIIL